MNNVLRPCQQRNVAQNDNAVETVVYKSQHAAKQRCEGFHRSSPVVLLQQQDHRTDGCWKSKYRRGPERDERVQGNETAGFVPLPEVWPFRLVGTATWAGFGTASQMLGVASGVGLQFTWKFTPVLLTSLLSL